MNRTTTATLPHYDRFQSYEWNYANAPPPQELDLPPLAGDWQFCGLPVGSPLGIPAGPLLNGRWCLYYASLGFDVLTYKNGPQSRTFLLSPAESAAGALFAVERR